MAPALQHSRHDFRIMEALPGPPLQLFLRGAGVFIRAAVKPKNITIRPRNPRGLRDGVGHRAKALLALTQCLGCVLAVGYVLGEDDETADDVRRSVPGLHLTANPLTASIGVLEDVLVGELIRSRQ